MNEPGFLVRIALGIGLAKRTVPATRLQSINPAPADAAAQSTGNRARQVAASAAPHRPYPEQSAERSHSAGMVPRTEHRPASRPGQTTANPAAKPQEALSDGLPTRGKTTDIGTVMPAAAQLTGDLEIEESIVLQCVIRGNVTQTGDHQVVLTATGGIHGVLRAHTAVIGGTVEGDVHADRVVLLATGVVHGNIEYSTIAIKEGATVNGLLTRIVPNVVGGDSDPHGEPTRAEMPGLRAVASALDRNERAA